MMPGGMGRLGQTEPTDLGKIHIPKLNSLVACLTVFLKN